MASARIWRHSAWDAALVALSGIYGAALVAAPSVPLVALGLWWTANTVAHNFIHLPFFRARWANESFSIYLTLLQGFPQRLWRARHLTHHAERTKGSNIPIHARWRWTFGLVAECATLLALWGVLAIVAPRSFVLIYLPGWALGLMLCSLQGHFEHARGTTSHYGHLYNVALFNDGYHVEHHRYPRRHWTQLPADGRLDPASSRWPAVFRWCERLPRPAHPLDVLERIVIHSPRLQQLVVRAHARAIRAVLASTHDVRRIIVVGGGLFPRTALVLRDLFPAARITVVESDRAHLEEARRFLPDRVELAHRTFSSTDEEPETDLVSIPLAFRGNREDVYARPPARVVLVHDWIWRPRGHSAPVGWWLLKRVNVVTRPLGH